MCRFYREATRSPSRCVCKPTTYLWYIFTCGFFDKGKNSKLLRNLWSINLVIYNNKVSRGLEQLLHLIKGCAANDAKCQKVFYEKYLGFALKTVYRYLSSYEAAAEVTNDAFIKIFRAFGKFEYEHAANVESLLMAWQDSN